MLSVCEEWSLQSWQDLPCMNYARSLFNPCEFHLLLYLCGYGSKRIETFNRSSYCFTVIDPILPVNSGCIATVYCDQLFIISASYMAVLRDIQGLVRLSQKRLDKKPMAMGNMAPLLDEVNGVVYVERQGVCYCIHLEDGVTRQVCS